MTVHNRKEKTLSCLNRIVSQKLPKEYVIKIYLTDDGSTDGTSDAIRKLYEDKVVIIQGDGNLFWNRGMFLAWTEAIKHGGYDYYLWLNDDTDLHQEAISNLIKAANKYQDSIIVGSTCSSTSPKEITYGGYKENLLVQKRDGEIQECDFFNGNIVLVPNSVVEKVGILDPYFHHSFGDFEYGKRARKNGIKSYVIGPIGTCDRNSPYVKWMNPEISVFKRIKILYSPLGFNPFEAFRVEKYDSLLGACMTFVYLHCKAFFPKLFKQHR